MDARVALSAQVGDGRLDAAGAFGFAAAGWLAALACALASAWHVRKLAGHAPPTLEQVGARLAGLASETEREHFLTELGERRREAERSLSLAVLLPRSLARVSLATGTAFSLTMLARGLPLAGPALIAGAMGGFAGGLIGMTACAAFGRQARSVAAELRLRWKQVLGVVEREWTRAKGSG
jgi:hypothetical protein